MPVELVVVVRVGVGVSDGVAVPERVLGALGDGEGVPLSVPLSVPLGVPEPLGEVEGVWVDV